MTGQTLSTQCKVNAHFCSSMLVTVDLLVFLIALEHRVLLVFLVDLALHLVLMNLSDLECLVDPARKLLSTNNGNVVMLLSLCILSLLVVQVARLHQNCPTYTINQFYSFLQVQLLYWRSFPSLLPCRTLWTSFSL